MIIFNLVIAIVALALFAVLMKRVIKRIKSLEHQIDFLFRANENLSEGYNRLNNQLNDVRKSLDNY